MSKQIEQLMASKPHVFYDVSYEGADGIWLYMQPGWYCASSDTGTIHEYTVKRVLECAGEIYFDEDVWRSRNPSHQHDQPLPTYEA